MKVCPQREGTGSNYTREQRAPFGGLDPVPVCFLQRVGKRYPFKAVRTLKKKKKREKKRRKAEKKKKKSLLTEQGKKSLLTEPIWEHKALSRTSLIFCARCKSILREAPKKGACQPEERL